MAPKIGSRGSSLERERNHMYGPGYNNGRFPEEAPVLVRYPLHDYQTHDRGSWPWLPGAVLHQCGPDEWCVVVEVPALATPDPSTPNDSAPESLLYPACFRDATEIHVVSPHVWQHVRDSLEHG